MLGAVAHTPEQLDIDLTWIEAETKGKPFGVDLLVPGTSPARTRAASAAAELRQLLPERSTLRRPRSCSSATACRGCRRDEVAARRGLDRRVAPTRRARPRCSMSPSPTTIRLVASALGPPPPHFIERAHAAGRRGRALAGTRRARRRHKAAGADLIVAQGTEAGGHTGKIATMVLVPEVVDAVAPMPVLAAGGIARGRQIAAAMALGADGVWCGSVWLTTEEAETHPAVKEKFLAAAPRRHGAVAVADRQAGAHAAHRVDRRVGARDSPDRSDAVADRCWSATPQCASTACRRPGGHRRRASSRPTSSVRSSARWTGCGPPARSCSTWSRSTLTVAGRFAAQLEA